MSEENEILAGIVKPSKFVLKFVSRKGQEITVGWIDGNKTYDCSSKVPIHPDFKVLMDKLVTKLTDYYDMIGDCDDYTSFKKCEVTKYGDDKGQSVCIAGVYSHPQGKQNTDLKTAKIQTHNTAYGFEQELALLVGELAEEACAYVFDGRSNQETMDFNASSVVEEEVESEA